jgi:tRNA threonylcarbamoyladenosine modification (KEOPS) complex  Pcc1 subunit
MITISVEIKDFPKDIENIISKSILLEKIDINYISISNSPFKIDIKSPSITRGRAIMNSYIFWIYTILRVIEEVK